jgi:protein-L-isoaspartate(D-aspartate) O-methyltransferase
VDVPENLGSGWEEQRRQTLRKLLRCGRDPRVVKAIGKVPRERFTPARLQQRAYEDVALPIAFGQSLSQISVVAIMTEALGLNGGERVLEVGTGSGYQAAVLAEMGASVVTVERLSRLAASAASRLSELGYSGVAVHTPPADVLGFPEAAPYRAILVTAAARSVPIPLLAQLQPGGRMVLPVDDGAETRLILVEREESGAVTERTIGRARFVPLVIENMRDEAPETA